MFFKYCSGAKGGVESNTRISTFAMCNVQMLGHYVGDASIACLTNATQITAQKPLPEYFAMGKQGNSTM